jgi:hypothetical protein
LKRKGEGLEVLLLSLLLFPSRRRSETLKASPSSLKRKGRSLEVLFLPSFPQDGKARRSETVKLSLRRKKKLSSLSLFPSLPLSLLPSG